MESPDITLMRESARHVSQGLSEVGDIWRHEALKKAVELGLSVVQQSALGRWALEQASGGTIDDERLATSIGSLELAGPIGLAPGWDKPGKTLLAWDAMGARHATAGAVNLWGQPGKRMPRLVTFDTRLGDHGTDKSVNSFGFSSVRWEKAVYNLKKQRETGLIGAPNGMPVIVQVTMNKEMYETENVHQIAHWLGQTVKKVAPVADAISLGLSSFNTDNMRNAQDDPDFVRRNVEAAKNAVPEGMDIIYKGDADGGEKRLDIYSGLVNEFDIIMELINSTGMPRLKAKYGAEDLPGALAGGDTEFQQMAEDAVRYVYEATGGDIIGVGGVGVGRSDQAVRLIRAGASALSVNTGIRSRKAKIMTSTERDLIAHLDTLPPGQDNLRQIIGADTKRGPKYSGAA